MVNTDNADEIENHYQTWLSAKDSYITKNKENRIYSLTNACGSPSKVAKTDHAWPREQVITRCSSF